VPPLLEEALAHAGDGPCTLRCDARLADLAEPLLSAHPEARLVRDDSTPFLLLVESRGGELLVEATPGALLRSQRRRLAVEACRLLEEELALDPTGLHRGADGEES
jgi:hypothetical protein